MHVIVLKYVQVLCITIFFSNNINCDKLLLHNEREDQELYRIGACTAACMADADDGGPGHRESELPAGVPAVKSIGLCYKQCSEDGRPLSAWRPLVQRQNPSLHINLICRDSSNLIIEIKPDAPSADEPLMKLTSPGGNQNQLRAVPTAGRSKRAIGSDGSLAARPSPLTDLRQKASGASRANQLVQENTPDDASGERSTKSDATYAAGEGAATRTAKDRASYQRTLLPAERIRPTPIYLVKVQESGQELGDRIVYMCHSVAVSDVPIRTTMIEYTERFFRGLDLWSLAVDEAFLNVSRPTAANGNDYYLYTLSVECDKCPFTKLQRIPAEKKHTVLKIDAARQLGLRFLDRDVGKYSFDNDTYLCQFSAVQLGEFGVYDASIQPNGSCTLVTAKEPVSIYLPFLTIALIVCATIGLLRLAHYGLQRSRTVPVTQPQVGTGDAQTEEAFDKPESETPTHVAPKKRLQSLDTFRGIAIMLMIFVNSGGGQYWWIEHATWNGLHVADLVFPWFLFIMGVCVPISLRTQLSRNVPRRAILSNIAVRSIKLFVIGLCLNSINGPTVANLRIFGVLQRFGVAYFVVSTVHLFCHEQAVPSQNRLLRATEDIFRLKKQWLIVGVLTVLYLVVIFFVAEPGCPRAYFGPGGTHLFNAYPNCTGGITGYIDRAVLGVTHLYQHPTARYVYDAMPFDPEGPFGCLPTILQVFLGLQCGGTILAYAEHRQRLVRFAIWAALLGLLAGVLCGFSKNDGWIPVNKNLWSLSYVLATGSLAYLLLALCYYAIDVKRAWNGRPFVYAGMNAIVLYVGHTIFHKMLPWHWRIGLMNTHFMLTLEALWNTVLWNLIALYLFKRKMFYNL
uniref:Heparan-alpha-glucosaminide N-acetyltransferase catalytic domain-containing protein n=1 Tax=Anopheles dirus TaxID=7168 RepID=A0A182NJS0_9DIPT